MNFVQFLTGTDVTLIDNISNSNPPRNCPANDFAPIAGELIPGPSQIDPGTKQVIQVQVYTTRAGSYQTYLANLATNPNASLALTPPTGTVTIYDSIFRPAKGGRFSDAARGEQQRHADGGGATETAVGRASYLDGAVLG